MRPILTCSRLEWPAATAVLGWMQTVWLNYQAWMLHRLVVNSRVMIWEVCVASGAYLSACTRLAKLPSLMSRMLWARYLKVVVLLTAIKWRSVMWAQGECWVHIVRMATRQLFLREIHSWKLPFTTTIHSATLLKSYNHISQKAHLQKTSDRSSVLSLPRWLL